MPSELTPADLAEGRRLDEIIADLKYVINELDEGERGRLPYCDDPADGCAESWIDSCERFKRVAEEFLGRALLADREAVDSRAAAAEASAVAMLETLKAAEYQLLRFGHGFWECNCRDLAQDGRVCNKHELAARITRTIREASDPGRAANELRALREAETLLAGVYSQAGNGAPAEYRHVLTPRLRDDIRDWLKSRGHFDQALSQGEQRGEGENA